MNPTVFLAVDDTGLPARCASVSVHVKTAGRGMWRFLAVALVGSFVVGASARADDFVAISQQDIAVDGAAGKFDYRAIELDTTQATALRARIVVRELKRNDSWAPAFRVAVMSDAAEVAFGILANQQWKMAASLRYHKTGSDRSLALPTAKFDFVPRLNEPFVLEMSWKSDGQIHATVVADGRSEAHDLELGGAAKTIMIFASNGRMEVTPLELGQMKATTGN